MRRCDTISASSNDMAGAERWAAGMSNPAYAIDDQTAIKVIDGSVEVVSEGHWKLFVRESSGGDTQHA
jgi:hypothetical protein